MKLVPLMEEIIHEVVRKEHLEGGKRFSFPYEH